MKLKIIGGPRDGQFADLTPGARDIELPDPPGRLNVLTRSGVAPAMVEVSHTYYTVRELHCSNKWRLRFLTPADWPDWKAIEHQFRK